MRTITVPNRPELIAAMATGDIAYKKPIGTLIQLLVVKRFNKLKIDHIINNGAHRNISVINSPALPSKRVAPIANSAIQGGEALELPIPT